MADQRVMGPAACPLCGCKAATAKQAATGLAYIHCPPVHDGGCNTQIFGRSPKASELIAKRVTKWQNDELKNKYRGEAPASPAPEPAPQQSQTPPPARPALANGVEDLI